MNRMPGSRKRQRGAVAIIVGLSMFVLIGMLALVVDLGHLYVAKTELQNAADAAALAGAKKLNGKLDGVNAAVADAIALAQENRYDFSKPVDITIADIWLGNCPDDGCMMAASSVTSDALAVDKTFLKVDTGNRELNAWFARIWGTDQTRTYGMAVAGRYDVDITPIGICGLTDDPANPRDDELGFERGVSYRLSDANPIGPGTMFWIDPVATAPGTCSGDVPAMLPYMCSGKIGFTPEVGSNVYTNTGISTPQLEALDSRFGLDNPAQSKCDPSTARADQNTRQYVCVNATGSNGCVRSNSPLALEDGTSVPGLWMESDPVRQSIRFVEIGGINQPVPLASRTFQDYGVLWSRYRPTGTTVAQWNSIYGGTATSYPETSPYAQGSGTFFQQPPVARRPGEAGRRLLHMVVVECKASGGVCAEAKVLGVGKFFLQRQTDASGSTGRDIYVEFGGLLEPTFVPAEIRLYR